MDHLSGEVQLETLVQVYGFPKYSQTHRSVMEENMKLLCFRLLGDLIQHPSSFGNYLMASSYEHRKKSQLLGSQAI